MFGGLGKLFQAIGRLTTAVTHSAELFEAANQQLEERLGFDEPQALALPQPRGNGRQKVKALQASSESEV